MIFQNAELNYVTLLQITFIQNTHKMAEDGEILVRNFIVASTPQEWGAALKALREEFGLSVSELARRTNRPRKTIQRLEKGEGSPTTDSLGMYIAALDGHVEIGLRVNRTPSLMPDAESEPERKTTAQPGQPITLPLPEGDKGRTILAPRAADGKKLRTIKSPISFVPDIKEALVHAAKQRGVSASLIVDEALRSHPDITDALTNSSGPGAARLKRR